MIKRLLVRHDRCTDCGMCETVHSGFYSMGKLLAYDDADMKKPECRKEIDALITVCPERAIYLKEYPDVEY